MSRAKVTTLTCDFCPVSCVASSDAAKKFERLGGFDICPDCFKPAYSAIAVVLRDAWFTLREPGNGPRNGMVLDLLLSMHHAAMHACVGGEETE